MAPKICNDEPVLLDELERWALVSGVGDSIANCDPPQVVGVHGDWGLGKTSFMHQVHFYLTNECPQQSDERVNDARARKLAVLPEAKRDDVRVVWFEAWRYQSEAAPVVALLHEMRSQWEWQLKLLGAGKKLISTAIRGALLSMEEPTIRQILATAAQAESSKVDDPVGRILKRLHFAEIINREPTGQQVPFVYAPAFPDPTDVNVFWVQRLVHEAAKDAKMNKGSVGPKAYGRYLQAVSDSQEVKK